MKELLGRLGGWPRVLMMASIVVIAVSLQPLMGTEGWAGLGQWAGGLGALFAAWAALRIAKDEAGRENRREADRYGVHAHYVRGKIRVISRTDGFSVAVLNESPEPITDVAVVAIHVFDAEEVVVVPCVHGSPKAVHLPNATWAPWLLPTDRELADVVSLMKDKPHLAEVCFTDLSGARWRRVGEQRPEPDDRL